MRKVRGGPPTGRRYCLVMASHRFRGPSDLHLHSDRSDGTEPPAGVMATTAAHGLRTVALTDHDTTAGWDEAAAAAVEQRVTFLPGMEMSAKHEGRSVHVLAYLIDPDAAGILAMTRRVRESRMTRARAMADRIARDYDVTWQDVLDRTADGATVGRPHIADALVAKGHVRDRTEAFRSILRPGGPYYVALYAPDPVTAVTLVADAGGVAVLAHPARNGRVVLPEGLLRRMLDAGLAGFELGHRENAGADLTVLRDLVAQRSLIVTGSSDYHGAGKPNVPGENTTADDMVARIIAAGEGSAPVYG